MDQTARDAKKIGDGLFAKKKQVDELWQEIALNFYPARADFTTERTWGAEFSDHLFTSYPVLARRELGNLFSSNLRPSEKKWVGIHVNDEDIDNGIEERRFLEYLTTVQWRAMYDSRAGFVTATKQADHDFAAFGNAVIRCQPNQNGDGLLYTTYHLRDCAWAEDAAGSVDSMHRNWKPTARQLKYTFGEKNVSQNVRKACEKDPEKEFACRHIVLPSRTYYHKGKGGKEYAYTSLYIECETETVMELTGLNNFRYVVPRWEKVTGSPYGRSMAADVALPDGRTMQVVIRVLREAGEKFVDPPMVAVMDAIRSDIAVYPGGVTSVDIEYDERLGEVLHPLSQDKSGMPIGFELAGALREDIRSAFYLDKIQLPEMGKEMTAFEVSRRLQEHMRASAPIFEPVREDYNDPLCKVTFDTLMEYGAFGPLQNMPRTLMGMNTEFKFRSPLTDMADQNEAEVFKQAIAEVILPAAQIDPAQVAQINLTAGIRSALLAMGVKAKLLNPIEAVAKKAAEIAAMQKAQMGMQTLAGGAQTAEQGSRAIKTLTEAEQIGRGA